MSVSDEKVATAIAKTDRYSEVLNEILGVLAFGFGLGAAGTENPSFFGTLSFAFILLLWLGVGRSLRPWVDILNNLKHPHTGLWPSVFRALPFVFAFMFLGFVAFGMIDKGGIVGH